MAFLSKSEAALKLGYSIELIEYFIKKCPKKGETRTLPATTSPAGTLIDEGALLSFQRYLNQPWPKGKDGRPYIPTAVCNDIKQESHFACAICGHMDNGEVAHIQDVSETLNNSPDNLILLCPNHHSKYDYGFKPSSNVDLEEVEAAKRLKRNSRRRMLRHEANATKALRAIIELVGAIKRNLSKDLSENLRTANITELEALIKSVPELCQAAEHAAATDRDLEDLDKKLAEIAPDIAKRAMGTSAKESERDIRARAESIVSKTKTVLIDIDEVDCPHCSGRGQYGWSGRLCAYCGGSGQQGLIGDPCALCDGDCVVSKGTRGAYLEKYG